MTEVTFSSDSQLHRIEKHTFRACKSLRKIVFPAQIAEIGGVAFAGCKELADIVFSKDSLLRCIEAGAFQGCKNLRSIELPERADEINAFSFSGCENLEAVTIKNPSLKLAKTAFDDCNKLRRIYAPKEWKAANRELLKSLPAYEPDENDPPEE